MLYSVYGLAIQKYGGFTAANRASHYRFSSWENSQAGPEVKFQSHDLSGPSKCVGGTSEFSGSSD